VLVQIVALIFGERFEGLVVKHLTEQHDNVGLVIGDEFLELGVQIAVMVRPTSVGQGDNLGTVRQRKPVDTSFHQ